MSKLRAGLAWVCVGFFVLSAVAHSILGWAALEPEVQALGADAELVEAIGIAWRLGGAAMLIFAGLCAHTLIQRRRSPAAPLTPLVIVGGGYAAYGAWAVAVSGGEAFFAVLFLVPGLLLAATGVERGR